MKKIDDVLVEVNNELNNLDSTPFSKQGFNEYKLQISKFVLKLYNESFRKAKKDSSDTINNQHVLDASNYLTKINRFKFKDLLNTFAGILLGLAIQYLITILTVKTEHDPIETILYFISGFIGALIFGITFSKES